MQVTKPGTEDAVVVLGASGGLGVASVQLARSHASTVVAVARGSKLTRVADLGATAVADSEADDWLDQVRAALPDGTADVVLDNIGGDLGESALALLGPGGRFSGHGTPSGRFAEVDRDAARARNITVTGIEAVQLDEETMAELTDRDSRPYEAANSAPWSARSSLSTALPTRTPRSKAAPCSAPHCWGRAINDAADGPRASITLVEAKPGLDN